MQDTLTAKDAPPADVSDLLSAFFALVLKSPPAIAVLGLSWFLGYGVSYMVFDYRRSGAGSTDARPTAVHVTIGLAYMAVIFLAANADLISRGLTVEDLLSRLPFTGLLSFASALVIIIIVTLKRK